MKSRKSFLVLIPAIGSASFVLSQWIMKANKTDILFGISSDALGGLVVGIGFGLMLICLKKVVLNGKADLDNCI